MECKPCESKKLMKVFDGSKRKKSRKKREGTDDNNSNESEDSASHGDMTLKVRHSEKESLHELTSGRIIDELGMNGDKNRENWNRDSTPEVTPHKSHSKRHHRRLHKGSLSLALKSGRVSTPRSISPIAAADATHDDIQNDEDSYIYSFLEDAIMKHKKKHRHLRSKHDETRESREFPGFNESRHHRRKHRDDKDRRYERRERYQGKEPSRTSEKMNKQMLDTFAKLCTQISEKANQLGSPAQVRRSLSHKSLQCEVTSKDQSFDDQRPCRLRTRENSQEILPSRIRSNENFVKSSQENIAEIITDNKVKRDYDYNYDKESVKYGSKTDIIRTKCEDRYRDYIPPEISRTRSHVEVREYRRDRQGPERDYDYDDRRRCEQKTSRSCYVPRERYVEEDRGRRAVPRDGRVFDRKFDDRDRKYEERDARDRRYAELEARERRYDERERKYEERDRRYEDRDLERRYEDRDIRERRYDERDKYDRIRHSQLDMRNRNLNLNSYMKDRRKSRKLDSKCDRMSVISKDDDYNRDRYLERERDSGLSVADDASTLSGKSNYLHVVKQEIAEQREAMDKMMRLWKELMRCFKGNPTGFSGEREKDMQTACDARDSTAEQLRLWKECMKRYETVARDVGDTDARLMDEINKQRSEMAEMATMWQECLQRYRDISNDFNSLKQKLTKEGPTRDIPAPPMPPMMCAPHCPEGEGAMPAPQFRMTPNYGPQPHQIPMGYMGSMGTQLRSRTSGPPAWWYADPRDSTRRRSSPDSRESPERDHRPRHKEHEREPTRYKDKKPSAARSEHRRRKR